MPKEVKSIKCPCAACQVFGLSVVEVGVDRKWIHVNLGRILGCIHNMHTVNLGTKSEKDPLDSSGSQYNLFDKSSEKILEREKRQ